MLSIDIRHYEGCPERFGDNCKQVPFARSGHIVFYRDAVQSSIINHAVPYMVAFDIPALLQIGKTTCIPHRSPIGPDDLQII